MSSRHASMRIGGTSNTKFCAFIFSGCLIHRDLDWLLTAFCGLRNSAVVRPSGTDVCGPKTCGTCSPGGWPSVTKSTSFVVPVAACSRQPYIPRLVTTKHGTIQCAGNSILIANQAQPRLRPIIGHTRLKRVGKQNSSPSKTENRV